MENSTKSLLLYDIGATFMSFELDHSKRNYFFFSPPGSQDPSIPLVEPNLLLEGTMIDFLKLGCFPI